jgi:hypothetical protein
MGETKCNKNLCKRKRKRKCSKRINNMQKEKKIRASEWETSISVLYSREKGNRSFREGKLGVGVEQLLVTCFLGFSSSSVSSSELRSSSP